MELLSRPLATAASSGENFFPEAGCREFKTELTAKSRCKTFLVRRDASDFPRVNNEVRVTRIPGRAIGRAVNEYDGLR